MQYKFLIGQGYDIHATQPGDQIILGGIKIPASFSLKGHSDADVVLHSISDAILGALGLGDIGTHFCDTDPKNKNICSASILNQIMGMANFKIQNIDCTVVLQEPKLRPYVASMKKNLQAICNTSNVNIKAKTNEHLDSAGRSESVICHSVVLLYI